MEDCHLLGIDTFSSVRQLNLRKTDTILETRGYSIFISRCIDCGMPFLGLAIEPRSHHGVFCNYWVPISEDEIEHIRINHDLIRDFMNKRRHITWQGNGKISWAQGNEPHLELAFAGA